MHANLVPLHLFLILTSTITSNETREDEIQWRLPTTLKPISYEIYITVPKEVLTRKSNKFYGMVVINIEVRKTTKIINLHVAYKYIKLDLITVEDKAEKKYKVDETTDILTIWTEYDLRRREKIVLAINYTGSVDTDHFNGFYRSSYRQDGETKYLVSTQFEPTFARKAFPCFDEPSFKSTFEIYLTYPTGYTALSNSPGMKQSDEGTTETMMFEETPLMSTYLIAFVISNFTCSEGLSLMISSRVCSKEENIDSRSWPLQITSELLTLYEDYIQYPYNFSLKLDHIIIPQFTTTAMENWGLIIYSEKHLLWDPEISTAIDKCQVVLTISHEVSHAWFGNLVTCHWWSVLFLNEGLARFFDHFIAHLLLPTWEIDKSFIIKVIQNALRFDSVNVSPPLQVEVSRPDEILSNFNTITYDKGGAIIHMLMHVMGFANFRQGLRGFLTKFQYATVQPEDLWQTLEESINHTYSKLPIQNLTKIMKNWITKPGFPLIHIVTYGHRIYVKQERFLSSGKNEKAVWNIPISYTTSEEDRKFQSNEPQLWLTEEKMWITIETIKYKWFLINNVIGYFRVNYEDENWISIAKALHTPTYGNIPDINRAQIVDDLFSLAAAGITKYKLMFKCIQFLSNDTSLYSWWTASQHFYFLHKTLGSDSDMGKALEVTVLRLIQAFYSSVSFTKNEENDYIYTITQIHALNTACYFGEESCISSCKLLYYMYKTEGIRPPKNLRLIVYCVALRHSVDETDWLYLFYAYKDSINYLERQMLIKALGCSQDERFVETYLAMSITPDSGIALEDRVDVFKSVCMGSLVGVDFALNFLIENLQDIQRLYPGENIIHVLVQSLAAQVTKIEQFQKLESLMRQRSLFLGNSLTIKSYLEAAHDRIEWKKAHEKELKTLLLPEKATDGSVINKKSLFKMLGILILSLISI